MILRLGIAVALVAAGSWGCARKPAVTMDQVYEHRSRDAEPATTVHPPRCEEFPLAEYPGIPFDHRPERVSVRVDLTIDAMGQPSRLRATALGDLAEAQPFIEAALAAARRIRCEPAWSDGLPDSEGRVVRYHDYRSAVVFHFHRDEKRVEVGP